MRTREETVGPPQGPEVASSSLHDQIVTAFTARLRADASGGEAVAMAVSALIDGRRVAKRDAIVEAVRGALTAKKPGSEDASPKP